MAEKRMFSKAIIDSDAFLDMPMSTQCLYFHLAMRADDDGFVNNPKKIQRMLGASDDDARILLAKRFILSFESGIIVIKHWRIHNYIQKDRYKPTTYQEEMQTLSVDGNKAYTQRTVEALKSKIENNSQAMDTECIQDVYNMDTECIQDVHNMYPQNRLDKIRLDESRKEKVKKERVPLKKPEDVSEELFEEWKTHKKRASKSCTQRMINHLVEEARKAGITTARAMEIQLERGWVGFEAEYVMKNNQTQTQPKKVEKFDDDYYKDAVNPDGSINWGI